MMTKERTQIRTAGKEEEGGKDKSGKRTVRSALARYARVEKNSLAVSQRAQVLLRRVKTLSAEVAKALSAIGNQDEAMRAATQIRRKMQASKFGPVPTREEQIKFQRSLLDDAAVVEAVPGIVSGEKRPVPLKLDELGREVDDEGRVVKKHRTAESVSLLVNKKNELDSVKKQVTNPYVTRRILDSTDALDSTFRDERLVSKKREARKARGLNFVPEGHYIKIAEATRREQRSGVVEIEEVEEALSEDDHKIQSEKRLVPKRSEHFASIPGMEWWDEPYLPIDIQEARARSTARRIQEDEYSLCLVEHCSFYTLIQHPKIEKSGQEATIKMPFYLTKNDRKRVRRQARAEREREKRDKIQLGLIPPPQPKFKLSNFMQVLGQQAVADPTKLEAKVIAQVNQRFHHHQMRNAARKLTPQEKRDKIRRKLHEDTSKGVEVALFYIRNLENTQHRFKLDVNAQQLNLSGIVVLCTSPEARFAAVLVEGGPNGIKRYLALIGRRIDWGSENWAICIWRGVISKRNFNAFRFHECASTSAARRIFEVRSLPHFWDMARTRHDQGAPGTEEQFRFFEHDSNHAEENDDDDDDDAHSASAPLPGDRKDDDAIKPEERDAGDQKNSNTEHIECEEMEE